MREKVGEGLPRILKEGLLWVLSCCRRPETYLVPDVCWRGLEIWKEVPQREERNGKGKEKAHSLSLDILRILPNYYQCL